MNITKEYLRTHPHEIFVFGDNLIRKSYGGAAVLRDEPNTYGFITKKYPNNKDESFYRPDEYKQVFFEERQKLINFIYLCEEIKPETTFLISQIGSGLANKYHIYEEVIEPGLECLKSFPNVKFLNSYGVPLKNKSLW